MFVQDCIHPSSTSICGGQHLTGGQTQVNTTGAEQRFSPQTPSTLGHVCSILTEIHRGCRLWDAPLPG